MPGEDKPRLTILTDTFLIMQDSFLPVSPKKVEPCWLLRWSQVAQVPESHLIHGSCRAPGAPCWDVSISVLFY